MNDIVWTSCRVRIGDLHAWERNPKNMTKIAAERLLKSWRTFGQVETLAIGPDNEVYNGHQRLQALLAVYGEDYEVDARRSSRALTEEERRALVIALHAGTIGTWDWEELSAWNPLELVEWGMDDAYLEQMKRDSAALIAMFHSMEIESYTVNEGPDPRIEALDELADKWGVQLNSMWRIPMGNGEGEHRLLCGDARDPENYAALLGEETARCCITDPPWNVAIGTDNVPRHRQRDGLINDQLSDEEFETFLLDFITAVDRRFDGDLYCVFGIKNYPMLDRVLRGAGYHWSSTIIWVKSNSFVMGRSNYHRRYEVIWYGWHKRGKSSYNGRRDLDDIWEYDRPVRSEEHPTMKPVPLIANAIINSSQPGDLILDPFVGAGTCLLACEQTGRQGRAIELDRRYVAVTLQRLADMGLTPVEITNEQHLE